MESVIGVLLSLGLLGMWIRIRIEDTRERQAQCIHQWEETSLYGQGRFWSRRCRICGKQEPIERPEQ